MKIQIKFFGQLRELTNTDETEIEMSEGSCIEDLSNLLKSKFPQIQQHLNSVSFALNNEYVKKNVPLKDGVEVGLLPPISGG